jgi:5'-deoxynucleotidase YfbR-like HD superfamily hydrolase
MEGGQVSYIEIMSLRFSGHVSRWHTLPFYGSQTVAEHSGQALSLLFMLYPGDPSIELIKALLWHDSAERHVGDMPAPVRRANAELAEAYEAAEMQFLLREHPVAHSAISNLTSDDLKWLKAIDVLELLLWCGDQKMLGNQHVVFVERRALGYLERPEIPEEVTKFVVEYREKGTVSFA